MKQKYFLVFNQWIIIRVRIFVVGNNDDDNEMIEDIVLDRSYKVFLELVYWWKQFEESRNYFVLVPYYFWTVNEI